MDQILANPIVRDKVAKVAERENVKKSVVWARARKQANFFIARTESLRFIRFAAWSVGSFMKSIYDQGVWVDSGEIVRLRETARVAALKGQSLIFLPCHRSHIDYVTLQLLYFQLGLSLPCIVAGENLNFPIVGPFLQNAGAFWIKRETPNEATDPLYTPLMTGYIDTILARGLNFECFIEGGRSRSGKMLPPKYGVLKQLCDSLLRLDKDAIVVPISIQYDNVLETSAYASELLGQPKTKESLSSFFKARKVLALRMGRIDARFAEGFSLREFIHNAVQERFATPDAPTTDIAAFTASPTPILRSLGYTVLNEINAISVVMPTALIGTVLLTIRGRGVGKKELIKRVAWLSDKIRAKGGRVASIDDYEQVVDKAIRVLGSKLVGVRKDLVEDTYYAADRFEISYFRNQVIHLFISEAIICVSLYSKVKVGGLLSNQGMKAEELQRQTAFLSQIMKGEFIYNTLGIEANIQAALQQLTKDNVIEINDQGYVELAAQEKAGGRESFDVYCFLLWPFVETYWFAGVSLFALTPRLPDRSGSVSYVQFEKAIQKLGKTLYYQGDLSYITAISMETLQNALQYMASIGAITFVKGVKKNDTKIEFTESWTPQRDASGRIAQSGKLWTFIDTIGISRREGKNRRDTATVGRRVLNLVDVVGEELQSVVQAKL